VPDANRHVVGRTIGSAQFDGTVIVVGVIATSSNDSHWAALFVVDVNGEVHKAVGASLARFAQAGRRITIRGTKESHDRYGDQIRVVRAVPVLEAEVEVSSPYDLLRLVPRVGAKRARLLVERFGEQAVINEIDRNPRRAFQRIAGMPYHHAGEATRWWLEHRRHRDV